MISLSGEFKVNLNNRGYFNLGGRKMNEDAMKKQAQQRLKFSEKLSFGLGELPNSMVSVLAAFLTMFYTDNVGLAAGAVGTMFFISKLLDGITDLLAGTIVDRTRTKWGKARPWLLWLSVPTGLALALIFFIPTNGSSTMKMIYAFVTYNLYNSILYTMVGCAKNALMPLMTQNAQDRMSLAKYNTIFGMGSVLVACSVTFPFVSKMGGDVRAWRIVFIVYGILTAAGLLYAFCNSYEHVQSVESAVEGKEDKVSFTEGIKMFVHNKYFLFALFINLCVQFAVQINSVSQTYFYVYSMENRSLTTVMNLASLIPMIISVVILPGFLLRTLGKKKMIYVGASAHCIFSLLLGVSSAIHSVPLLVFATVMKNLSTGAMAIPVGILAADAVDYGEYLTNRRIEGIGTAVITFSQKIASGLASGCLGWVLAITGYVANEMQSTKTIMGINMMFSYIPTIIFLIVLILFKFVYHYDKEESMVLEELENRKKNGTFAE